MNQLLVRLQRALVGALVRWRYRRARKRLIKENLALGWPPILAEMCADVTLKRNLSLLNQNLKEELHGNRD